MLATFRRRRRDEEGFTLIELMVVVLIIAILIAIAIPTFLGAQNRARDRAAQSNLRNALTAVKTVASDDKGLFTNVNTTTLHTAEMALTFITTAPVANEVTTEVNTAATPAQTVELSTLSSSGTYFGLGVDSNGGVIKCKGTTANGTDVDTYAHCQASVAAGDTW